MQHLIKEIYSPNPPQPKNARGRSLSETDSEMLFKSGKGNIYIQYYFVFP